VKKILSVSLALIGLLLALWLVASVYAARTTGNYMISLPDLYKQNENIHIKTVEHHQSLFSSSGKFEIRFPNFIPLSQSAPAALGFMVDYKISNYLLPESAGRLEWKMSGDDAIDSTLKQLFGQGPTMHGKGYISYDGQRRSTVELSELLFKDTQSSLQLTPLTGLAIWDNRAFAIKLNTDRLNVRTEEIVTDWRGISIDIDLKDRHLGFGQYVFAIDQGATDSSSFEAMKLIKTVSGDQDRINLAVAQTIKQYSFNKIKLSDVDQELALTGIDRASLIAISSALREAKDVNKLTVDERVKVSESLRTIFNKGFTLGIPRLATKIDGGGLTGNLNIEVLQSEENINAPFSSVQRLRATGQVDLIGKGGLDNAQRMTALLLGLAVKTPEGLKTSFEFSKGVINANGKSFDVKDKLDFLDNIINAVLIP